MNYDLATKTAKPRDPITGTYIVGFPKCGQQSLQKYLDLPLIEGYITNHKIIDYKDCKLIVITRDPVSYRKSYLKHYGHLPEHPPFNQIIQKRRSQGFNIKVYSLEELKKKKDFPWLNRVNTPKPNELE